MESLLSSILISQKLELLLISQITFNLGICVKAVTLSTGTILHFKLDLNGFGKVLRENTECLSSQEMLTVLSQQLVQETGLIASTGQSMSHGESGSYHILQSHLDLSSNMMDLPSPPFMVQDTWPLNSSQLKHTISSSNGSSNNQSEDDI